MVTAIASATQLDPVKFEVFAHRLWAIGEEGRIALQQVSASPIVVQGGECMSSFYDADGQMILACSGHLRFAAATSDAIKKLIEWFGESPGFFDGDQIYFNDPYVAGAHTYDQMLVMPIFHEKRLIGWTASSTHTADVGGLLRGSATEIFHEGVRILGLKVVEKGEFRQDVFKSLVEQCRDPQYVGLDLKSRIAANNVCSRRFLELVDRFGVDFVLAAGQKLLQDAQDQARARLRSLPDGTWRSRLYETTLDPKTRAAEVVKVECAMSKRGDELSFDFAGTSQQMPNDMNSTLPSTTAHVTIALTNQLFWDLPWNDGKMAPVTIRVEEGSILHCRFPAACGFAPWIGQIVVSAVSECLAKMLYAGGRTEDVNASWYSLWYAGGPGWAYGGHNREGLTTAQGYYDIHAGGLGATPNRDGVDTGGHMNIPSGGISDIERIEMQYPFVYFHREHNRDGGGFGRYRGGEGSQRLLTILGSRDASVNYGPYGGIPQGGFGLFGGYPVGFGGTRATMTSRGLVDRMTAGEYPATFEQALTDGWGDFTPPVGAPTRIPLPEHSIVSDFVQGGGGFGDPLDRPAADVAHDVATGATSLDTALRIYGVVLRKDGSADEPASERQRATIRQHRRDVGRPAAGKTSAFSSQPTGDLRTVLAFHAVLDIATDGTRSLVRCGRCGHAFCDASDNYKRYALEIERDLEEFSGRKLPSGEKYLGVLLEYACPGCGVLLQVDTYCPTMGGETPLWDTWFDLEGGGQG
jgi:N-methylhydantoinase B